MSYLDLIQYGKKYVDDYVLEAEKQLAKAYRDAFAKADADMADLYARLGDKIDLAEAQKYKRLENLKADIAQEYRKLTGKAIQVAGDTAEQSYIGAYQSSWFNMEQSIGTGIKMGVPPIDAIRASVFSEVSGASFKVRFGKLYVSTMGKVAEAITRGLASGTGYAKTAKEVRDLWAGSYSNALRVIRTESTRNYQEGNIMAYERAKEAGVKGVQVWLATFDERTREDHARMNGKEADEDGMFDTPWGKSTGPGDGPAEEVINCRCSTYYKLKGYEDDYSPDWKYSAWEKQFQEWQDEPPRVRGL